MFARNLSVNRRVLGALLLISLAVGCSGKYAYRNTLAKNLHIQTKTESGSFISSVSAAVGIYRVDDHCKIDYQGTVDLDEPSVSVGIPSGRPSYLVFEFASSSFLAGSSRSVSYETLLLPAPGHDYAINVSYVDDIYNVEIQESQPGETTARDIRRKSLRSCASA